MINAMSAGGSRAPSYVQYFSEFDKTETDLMLTFVVWTAVLTAITHQDFHFLIVIMMVSIL